MSQTQQKETKDNLEELISNLEEEDDEDDTDGKDSDDHRAYFSMALSVVVCSVLLKTVPLLSGAIVGIALWFVVSVIVSNILRVLGWSEDKDNKDDLDDFEVLQMAYKRGMITEQQFEDSLDQNIEN